MSAPRSSPTPATPSAPHGTAHRCPMGERRDSWLGRLDPRTKLVGAVALMVSAFWIRSPLAFALALALLALMGRLGRLRPREFLPPIATLLVPFAIISALNLLVTRSGTVIARLGALAITVDGVSVALTTLLRVAFILCVGAMLLASTTPTRLTDGLAALLRPLRRLGVPVEELSFVLSLALRFVPTLGAEFESVREAQLCRGVALVRRGPLQRVRALGSIVVPVMAGALRHADNLSLALDARGFESGRPRSQWHPLGLSARDGVALAAVGAFWAVLIVFG